MTLPVYIADNREDVRYHSSPLLDTRCTKLLLVEVPSIPLEREYRALLQDALQTLQATIVNRDIIQLTLQYAL